MLDFNYNCQKNVKMTASTEKALNQNNVPIPPLESGIGCQDRNLSNAIMGCLISRHLN
jgi:hypothetical protein